MAATLPDRGVREARRGSRQTCVAGQRVSAGRSMAQREDAMRFQRFTASLAAGAMSLSICFSGLGALRPASQAHAAPRSPLVVVEDYFRVLDADLKTGNFSNLGSAYAANATLKVLDVHGIATEYHGLAAIIKYWQHRGRQVPGLHFTADRVIPLDAHHVTAFERTITNQHKVLAGRCAHLFKVIGGKIVFDAYFGVAFTKSELALK
jgi:hypothetical protein